MQNTEDRTSLSLPFLQLPHPSREEPFKRIKNVCTSAKIYLEALKALLCPFCKWLEYKRLNGGPF